MKNYAFIFVLYGLFIYMQCVPSSGVTIAWDFDSNYQENLNSKSKALDWEST